MLKEQFILDSQILTIKVFIDVELPSKGQNCSFPKVRKKNSCKKKCLIFLYKIAETIFIFMHFSKYK